MQHRMGEMYVVTCVGEIARLFPPDEAGVMGHNISECAKVTLKRCLVREREYGVHNFLSEKYNTKNAA